MSVIKAYGRQSAQREVHQADRWRDQQPKKKRTRRQKGKKR